MNQNQNQSDDFPALLGGEAIRSAGPPDWPPDDPQVAEALRQVIAQRSWGKYDGEASEQLTRGLAVYQECEQVLLCSSGTVAVELALRGLKVGPGDEVVLAAYDFKGNFMNVVALGARPVLIDIDPANGNLDPDGLEAAISKATRAIIVSHLHGGIVPMPRVMELAAAHGIPVIEDACQMPGALIHARKSGTWGDVGVLSFGGSKLLSAGRGGALMTNRPEIFQRARLYSHRGNDAYPLSELQAAVLLPQLEQLDERNRSRSEHVALLQSLLSSRSGLTPFQNPPSQSAPGFYKLGINYDPEMFDGLPRDLFAAAMRAEGVAMDAGFRALHRIHGARRYRQVGELANAGAADDCVLMLHHPVLLGERMEIVQVVDALDKVRLHAKMICESRSVPESRNE
jgi:dTDP-4-amino-4,6-dideoxygalactose transaminase